MMEYDITRRLYRLLPFMFIFQFLVLCSVFLLILTAAGLDLSTPGDVQGFKETVIMLPVAFILTIFDLWIFPRLKYEEPAMLLFFAELMLNGALMYHTIKIWRNMTGW